MKYTREVLDEILQEGGATVLGEYKLYNQRMRVRFRCSCGVETSKKFEMLNVYKLPYYETCSKKHMVEKAKATCMEKYGVDNAGRDPEIKKKINDSYIKKYGMHPLKTPEIIISNINSINEIVMLQYRKGREVYYNF
jgi:hypothetical protein